MAVAHVESHVRGEMRRARPADQNGDEVNRGLKIGQLARRVGVTTKAIRFYERKRLLPTPARAANGYRVYGHDAVETLRFVKQASGLGLTLAEVKEIIAIRDGGAPPCGHVRLVLEEKAHELDRKLRDLIDMRRQIRRSLAAWSRTKSPRAAVCPHIERSRAARAAKQPLSGRKS